MVDPDRHDGTSLYYVPPPPPSDHIGPERSGLSGFALSVYVLFGLGFFLFGWFFRGGV